MRTFWSLLVLAATAALCRAEPKDVIKAYNLEVTPIEYKGSFRPDPFIPKVPLKAGASPEDWRVRIASLKLTSVILGKRKVAVFQESSGPSFAYILVNGSLLGPDHKAVPGIEGSIDALPGKREYRVVLKQGVESVEFTLAGEKTRAGRKADSAQSDAGGSSISSK